MEARTSNTKAKSSTVKTSFPVSGSRCSRCFRGSRSGAPGEFRMRTHVEFRSAKFPPDNPNGEMNEGRWGRKLAYWLQDNLPKHGVEPVGLLLEDWGYLVPLVAEHFEISIACG